ncbi:UDP-2,3-diacylglucosamine diphosphatase [Alkalisalibacterium limincola]|uniref:UDP-2,3-diacylglucosamine hydrolase n=1 Tax=Alkalisalibacterium limincola TaxID=2699169 RepID=A0A5C8KYX5_9GAMM|nr:UDP-2,3-diacylglucosamine diphosphatase [Alkalisalibacterium limincola]TXK66027.1 UDP-2,3-diacylglucosamine diphosphatase [Alkalisalibacterium limincola]
MPSESPRTAKPTTLFVSDLHLDASRPQATAAFLAFLAGEASQADALYILGDLFEAWVGDDDTSEPGASVASALARLSASGVAVHFMRGNRDFLLGEAYAGRCGMRLLADPCVVRLQGEPVLLTHGDLLCTDDLAYQDFRRQVHDPAWQRQFLAQPLAARHAFAAKAREASRAHHATVVSAGQAEEITDVSPDTVEATFVRFGVQRMIHGHTHRPAVHELHAGGRGRTRVVLGDWYDQGSVLRVGAGGWSLDRLAIGAS